MHQLTSITIRNYRSCLLTQVPLAGFTPIVGYNNAGKSNILNAIEWLLQPDALRSEDFNQLSAPIVMEGVIIGVTETLLDSMPRNQGNAVKPYLVSETLRIRRTMAEPGAATTARLEVRNPDVLADDEAEAWSVNPTGLQSALKVLFPDCIRLNAMEDAGEDVGKSSRSNTIGKLIAAIVDPIRAAHDVDLKAALGLVARKLSAEGEDRADELVQFDDEASRQLGELFPGLGVRLDIPAPEVPDLFKNGFIQVLEDFGSHSTVRKFDSVGHGAQRCVQMALIRYLAEKKATAQEGKRALLLIDEPELYLLPQGVEQVRQALQKLSDGQYQVVFTTHNPLLLHREQAGATVIVRKPDPTSGTIARLPMTQAINDAIQDAPHQTRMLFDLSRSAEVFFSDRVLLSEGKTEGRLIPLLYERIGGQASRLDKVGLVSMGSASDIPKALTVLRSMQIEAKV